MTVPFSPAQKYRILVTFDAQVIVNDTLTPVSRYVYGVVSETRRYAMLRRMNCAVRCACGCDVWSPLGTTDFDHIKEHVSGGPTAISNGAPLRRHPCHAAKTAASAGITGWVTRTKRKLSVTTGLREDDSILQGDSYPKARPSRRSWPQRSFPKSSRPMQSRPFQKRWEPRT
jgi:hypothetical protein